MIDLKTIQGRHQFYLSKEWKGIRKVVLARQSFCVECKKEGRLVEATEVDHIIDIQDAPERCLDLANLQGLCKSCHSKKTFQTSKGFCNHKPTPRSKQLKWNIGLK